MAVAMPLLSKTENFKCVIFMTLQVTLFASNATLIRRQTIIEYAKICANIIMGMAEQERILIDAEEILLNPFTVSMLYRRFLSYEHNDENDLKKSELAYFYTTQLKKEIQSLLDNTEEPRFFVIAIKYKEVD